MKKPFIPAAIVALSLGVASMAPVLAQELRLTGSGASFPFLIYSTWFKDFSKLSAVSETSKSAVGQGTTVQWPKNFVKAPKNDGVTATIKQTPGAIGYIEYGYAIATKQPMAVLQNKAGKFIAPGDESGKAALASAEFPTKPLPGSNAPDLRVWISDPAGETAYPIATFTWMLFYKDQDDAKAKALRDLVEYSLTKGQTIAPKMGYIPLPDSVIA